jgi:alpha-1,2-mannosyltransferase
MSCAAAAVAVAVLPPLSILLADGQLGTLLLMALLGDSLAVPARCRGYLTGLVTAIKIYPAIFVVVWLWRRQWADVARAVSAWAVVTGIAALLWPSYTSTFISRLVDGTEVTRFTHFIHWRATSSSPYTVFFRWPFGNEHFAATIGTLACVAVVALALWASQRARRATWPLSEFVIILMASTLAAPVVWDHYFVWFALLPLVALEVGVRRPLGILVLAATVIALCRGSWGETRAFPSRASR